jgi:hypothetical protein
MEFESLCKTIILAGDTNLNAMVLNSCPGAIFNYFPLTGLTKPDEVAEISCPISVEIALPRLQSEIKVALFVFASRSFLANNLHFMVKLTK